MGRAWRGEVPRELSRGGGAPGARLWDATLTLGLWGKEKATWCSGFFLQWGCISTRSQLMSCQGPDTFYLAICGIKSGADYSGKEDWNGKSST